MAIGWTEMLAESEVPVTRAKPDSLRNLSIVSRIGMVVRRSGKPAALIVIAAGPAGPTACAQKAAPPKRTGSEMTVTDVLPSDRSSAASSKREGSSLVTVNDEAVRPSGLIVE